MQDPSQLLTQNNSTHAIGPLTSSTASTAGQPVSLAFAPSYDASGAHAFRLSGEVVRNRGVVVHAGVVARRTDRGGHQMTG